ncbi:MAG: VTT domain-containing protein [Polaribacter sp.]|nr:VTT domain-containing protein [Polaribacter sp.]MDG1227113.1 VTT domain-containing protein [Polaribacter sp.]
MTKRKKIKTKKERAKLMHSYYSRTGFYMFIWESLKKAFIPIVLVVIGLFFINSYVFNINEALQSITETFSRLGVFTFFFTSETLLGLIPPEIFIAWSKKTSEPILNLAILASLSYSGGLLSYFIGKIALKINSLKTYLEVKMAKHLKNSKKWGGFLILVGALLPVPFSISCIAAGMIKYPFKNVVLFGLFRFARFAIYAWAIFQVVD